MLKLLAELLGNVDAGPIRSKIGALSGNVAECSTGKCRADRAIGLAASKHAASDTAIGCKALEYKEEVLTAQVTEAFKP